MTEARERREVVQCGFCQPGQIMSAIDLLSRNPEPADAGINAAMNGQLCRCGTCARIPAAIREASRTPTSGGAPS